MRRSLSFSVALACLSAVATAQNHRLFVLEEGGADSLGQAVTVSSVNKFAEPYPDIAVGAPFDAVTGPQSGCVRVYSGLSGLEKFVVHGEPGDQLGMSVAVGDDWNLDGTLDYVIGAPQGTGPCGQTGYVRLVSGVDGSTLVEITGEDACSLFGTAVASIDDVNGDGFKDVLIGAPSHGVGGAAFVVSPFAPTLVISGMEAPLAGARLGSSVAPYDDYNDDDIPDFLVGAPYSSFNGALSGSVFIVSGTDSQVLRQLHGAGARDFFGSDLTATDVNGDGAAEILIGAPQASQDTVISVGPGYVRIISGLDGHAPIATLTGDAIGDFFGASVAGAGDIDGDGDGEVLVGSPGQGQGGSVTVWDAETETQLYDYAGELGAGLGVDVAGGSDINRDGVFDLVAGGSVAGRVRVQSTQPLTIQSDIHKISIAEGGVMTVSIDVGPQYAGQAYYVLGSASGTVPGTFLVNMLVPLNWDSYFCELFVYPNVGPVGSNLGSLSPEGTAQMTLTVGAGALNDLYIGLFVQHTFIVFNPGDPVTPLTLVGKELTPLTLLE